MQTEVASEQMKWMPTQTGASWNWKQRHARLKCHTHSGQLLWATGQAQRENAKREKYMIALQNLKREEGEDLRKQSSLHICELEAKKETRVCPLLLFFPSKSSALYCKSRLVLTQSPKAMSPGCIFPVDHFTPWSSRNLRPKSENALVYLAARKSSCLLLTQLARNARRS